jgi:hypothetical protein
MGKLAGDPTPSRRQVLRGIQCRGLQGFLRMFPGNCSRLRAKEVQAISDGRLTTPLIAHCGSPFAALSSLAIGPTSPVPRHGSGWLKAISLYAAESAGNTFHCP